MADDADDNPAPKPDYKIGYGKPPKSGQIKPGEIRNPRGRPKGSRNRRKIIEDVANALIVVKDKGRRRKLTTFEVSQRQLAQKAAAGDLKAIAEFNRWLMTHGLIDPEQHGVGFVPNTADQLVMADIVKRIRAMTDVPATESNDAEDDVADPDEDIDDAHDS